ncbi:MAG: VWA domain-containing protein [Lactobacillus sp.]|nr:VWA domain-containing protein [Lactobacillus sp.]
MRRLPVYILLDTSGSMYGEPIEAVKNGLQIMISALRGNTYALETAYLSIITFNSNAQQVVPLTELSAIQQPEISASGCTALGAALSLVTQKANAEVHKSTNDVKGDWKPLVFIMSDGEPTDDLQKGINDFNSRKWGIVVACAAGNGANTDSLKKITENVVKLDTTSSKDMEAYFKWISDSVGTSSEKLEDGFGEVTGLSELPPPPPEVNIVV